MQRYWNISLIGLIIIAIFALGCSLSGEKTEAPTPESVVMPAPPATEPLTLADIRVTIIRLGSDITLLLDWRANETPGFPFHIWIEADINNVTLNSPSGESRKIEVILDGELLLYGSTLYHEHNQNRLVIDLQVKTEGK